MVPDGAAAPVMPVTTVEATGGRIRLAKVDLKLDSQEGRFIFRSLLIIFNYYKY